MLKEVELTEAFKERYFRRINLRDNKFELKRAREDFAYFAKFMLGFTLRDYQVYFLDKIDKDQKVACVKGRQIGFSTSIGLYCFWQAWFNKYPVGAKKITEITVISKDDDSAKDLLQIVKDFMYMGDKHMSNFLKGKPEHTTSLFSRMIVKNNVDELKLKNGCIVRSYPPTGKIRHTANSIVILDEVAFMNNPDMEKFYYTDVLPTISETGGKIVVSSTPNGYGGLFFELVDPENNQEKHEFKRYKFPFTLNKQSPNYIELVNQFKEHMEDSMFAQEYLCDFTQNEVSFFNSEKVKGMFDGAADDLELDKYEWIAGIDYGMTESRTVVTLATMVDGLIYRGYHREFEGGFDNNDLIPFMEGLKDRFKISKIVADYCPAGNDTNKKMIEKGWHIEEYDFHTKKEQSFVAFRSRMNKGEIKMSHDKATEKQFLEMRQEETKYGKLKIHKPRSGRDDIVDSMILASHHFLTNTGQKVGAYLV